MRHLTSLPTLDLRVLTEEPTQRIPVLSPVVEERVTKPKRRVDIETVLTVMLIWVTFAALAFVGGLAVLVWSWIF